MKHRYRLSFKGFRSGVLDSLTFICTECQPVHFKTVSPDDTKFLAAIHKDSKVDGAWTRRTNIEREKFGADILQPYKQDGTANEQFLKQYGKEAYKSFGDPNPQVHQRKTF